MQHIVEIATIIREQLSKSFSIPFGENGMKDDTNLIDAGMIDSFGLVELVTFLESRFTIRLTDGDLISPEITHVSGMASLVQKRQI